MNLLLLIVGCCLLAVLCWPLLVVALLLLPVVWLVSLPFRVLFIVVEALVAFIRALLFLPARLLGLRRS